MLQDICGRQRPPSGEEEEERVGERFNFHLQILVRGLRKVAQLSIVRIKEIAVHVWREDQK